MNGPMQVAPSNKLQHPDADEDGCPQALERINKANKANKAGDSEQILDFTSGSLPLAACGHKSTNAASESRLRLDAASQSRTRISSGNGGATANDFGNPDKGFQL